MFHKIPLNRYNSDGSLASYKNGFNYYQKEDKDKGFVFKIGSIKTFIFLFSIRYTNYGYFFIWGMLSWNFKYNEMHQTDIAEKSIKITKDWLIDKNALKQNIEKIKEENRIFRLNHPNLYYQKHEI